MRLVGALGEERGDGTVVYVTSGFVVGVFAHDWLCLDGKTFDLYGVFRFGALGRSKKQGVVESGRGWSTFGEREAEGLKSEDTRGAGSGPASVRDAVWSRGCGRGMAKEAMVVGGFGQLDGVEQLVAETHPKSSDEFRSARDVDKYL